MQTETQTWTGPALMNPRNRRGKNFETTVGAQTEEFRTAVHTRAMHRLQTVTIRSRYRRPIIGRIDEVVESPKEGKINFHLWRINGRGSAYWRWCYRVEVSIATGDITVTTIRIAPDHTAPASSPA